MSRVKNYDREKTTLRRYRENLETWAKAAIHGVRWRSKLRNIEFSITALDIPAPSHCPVLGIALMAGSKNHVDASPSVDRIDPTRGYVPGNVIVISYRANRLKSDATVDELRRVIAYMEQFS